MHPGEASDVADLTIAPRPRETSELITLHAALAVRLREEAMREAIRAGFRHAARHLRRALRGRRRRDTPRRTAAARA